MNTQDDFITGLASHAKEFHDASDRLSRSSPFLFHPTFYCALHAIELALKVHLAAAGMAEKELASRNFGHDLKALLNAARNKMIMETIPLGMQEQKAVEWGSDHYSGKCFEYPKMMYSTYPIGYWVCLGEKLVNSITRYIS